MEPVDEVMRASAMEVHLHQVFSENSNIACHLLNLDDTKILLDCGLPENFDLSAVATLEQIAPEIDLVLLSQPTFQHVGGLAVLLKYKPQLKVMSTLAVHRLARLCILEALDARLALDPHFNGFSRADVNSAFTLHENGGTFYQLRFMEEIEDDGITYTPCAAGYGLGGCAWRIQCGTENIIYSPEFNHKPELLLARTTMTQQFKYPTSVIMNAMVFEEKPTHWPCLSSDAALFDAISSCTRAGGNVLIACDGFGRTLELMLRLSNADKADMPQLYFAATTAIRLQHTAQTLLEYMNDRWSRTFVDEKRTLPFHSSRIQNIRNAEDVNRLLTSALRPVCVLAPFTSGNLGFARDALLRWADNPKNLVIVPDPLLLEPGTLLHSIYYRDAEECRVTFTAYQQMPLNSSELKEYVAAQKLMMEQEKRAREAEMMAYHNSMNAYQDVMTSTMTKDITMENTASSRESPTSTLPLPLLRVLGRTPMFQVASKPAAAWNAAGEAFDWAQMPTTNTEISPDTEAGGETHAEKPIAEEDLSYEGDVPTKTVAIESSLTVRCRCVCLAMEGRADVSSTKNIVEDINPQRIVLVRGSEAAVLLAREMLRSNLTEVLSGPDIDIASHDLALNTRIRGTLYKSLTFHKLKALQVSYLESVIDDITEADRAVVLAPVASRVDRGHEPVLVREGHVKIADLRKRLAKANIHCDVIEGGLITPEGIVVQRDIESDVKPTINIEGPYCEKYYEVRDVIYSMYDMV